MVIANALASIDEQILSLSKIEMSSGCHIPHLTLLINAKVNLILLNFRFKNYVKMKVLNEEWLPIKDQFDLT